MTTTPFPWNPTRRQMIEFGGVILIGCGDMGLVLMHKAHVEAAHTCWLVGGIVAAIAVLLPSLAKPLYWAWMGLGWALGQVTSRIVMVVLFYGLFTPVASFFRITGRDALRRKKPTASSYWLDHPDLSDKSHYDHLF